MIVFSVGRALRPLALLASAVLLVAFVLGGWVPSGHSTEQPRLPSAAPRPASDPGRARAEKAGLDLDAVVDTVRHRVTPAEDGSGALAANDERYRARFDAQGFAFTLPDHASGLGVSLRGVQRGGSDIALSPSSWTADANVARRGVASGMTERVTARAGELEWDVVLAHPPAGTGDLRLEAELRGLDGVPERVADGNGLRLPFDGGRAARMGEMVITDAAGGELYRALPQVSSDRMRLVVPAAVLADAHYPLTIDPTVGPELPVGDPVHGGALSSQASPAVAWNGTNFLVVWQDARSGTTADIYGARVSAAGGVLDPADIAISTAVRPQSAPAVAWNGTDFLVVWADSRSGTFFDDIYGARVSSAGTVLDPAGIPVSTAANHQAWPAVASSGTGFLVVWQDARSGSSADLYGARVSGAGSVLDPAGIPVSTAVNGQGVPAVAWNGTDFLVVWQDGRSGPSSPPGSSDIYGARVTGAGSVLDPAGIPVSTALNSQAAPAVAWNGADFLVVWEDPRSGACCDIYGARVTGAGSVLDPAGIPVSTAAGGQTAPEVARNGTGFLVVWRDQQSGASDIYGAGVSGAGGVLDPAGFPVSTAADSQVSPAVAWNGVDLLVVWEDPRSGSADIYGARVTAAGSVLDPAGIPVSTAADSQSAPAVAWNGTDFLVVWTDTRSPAGIYAARVSGAGSVLDPAGIPVSSPNPGSTPAVAWDGTNFLVVWQGSCGGICGARVSGAGSVLDSAGIPVSTAANVQSAPAVAWNGTNFLVVWQDLRNDGDDDNSDIYGARVSGAGGVLDPAGIPVSTVFGHQLGPAVAWNGTNFLVVWEDQRSGPSDIYGARVSGAGSVLDPAGNTVSTATNDESAPAVASWGDHFLVVWQDRRSGTSSDIYGAGVSAGGTVQQPAGIPISTAAGNQEAPDLAVRYHFLVAWRDRRSGTNDDVYATRVSPAGVVEAPAGLLVAGSATDVGSPAVTGGPGATWGVTYPRFAPESPYGANRVFLRSVSPK